MLDIHIGERIRALRELQNYTREGLAEKIDISSKFLYEIEAGKKGFSADVLCRIAQALEVSCDYIMFGVEEEYEDSKKIVCVLERLGPVQVSQIQDLLKTLCEICDIV